MKLLVYLISFMSFTIYAMGDPSFIPATPMTKEEKMAQEEKQAAAKKTKSQNIKHQAQEEKRPTSSSPNRDKEQL